MRDLYRSLAESLRMVNRTEFYGTRTERTERFLGKYMQPEGPGFEAAVERVKSGGSAGL